MKILNQQFQVTYQYPVYFTEHLFDPENPVLGNFLAAGGGSVPKKILFVLDEGMAGKHPGLKEEISHYLRSLSSVSITENFLEVPGGEGVKNEAVYLDRILSAIHLLGIDRHSYVAGVGGGAVLDLAGYAAAIAHRGIRHLRVPTTVLSQNDSGIGVKNGINFFAKKNFLGTFAPPSAVFNDSHFLRTLDDRNWRSGIAEAVKVALIKDVGFFEWLESHADGLISREMDTMEYLVYQCARLHLEHIASGDAFESGSSRPLDFGHWSAHKLEQLTNFSLTHGEAVAIGMAIDTLYSARTGWLEESSAKRICDLLQRFGFNLYHPMLEEEALRDGLTEFQEHLGGKLTIMLLRKIGEGENVHTMNTRIIRNCIDTLKMMTVKMMENPSIESC